MRHLLQCQVGARSLATMIGVLDAFWLASIWFVAENAKGGHLSLLWLGVLFGGPLIGVILSLILLRVYRTSGRVHPGWSRLGMIAGLAPICWWVCMVIISQL